MTRWIAVGTALFVTFLWSTSYILNKWAFAEGIHPLTLAGLRYGVAAVTLALVRRPLGRRPALSKWAFLGLGLAGYVVAQGFQYVGQYYVTPTQSGIVLSVGNTLLVLITGLIWLGERPGFRQTLGLIAAFAGVAMFYYPFRLDGGNLLGIGMLLPSSSGGPSRTARRCFARATPRRACTW
jgi:drug/metabolite transporter (DMT)-like permease